MQPSLFPRVPSLAGRIAWQALQRRATLQQARGNRSGAARTMQRALAALWGVE